MNQANSQKSIGQANYERIRRLIANKQTDTDRWAAPMSYSTTGWDYRLPECINLVPKISSLIDFGCGNMNLRSYLHPDINYQPVDLISRSRDTIVLDANADNWSLKIPKKHDILAAIGVLEYLHDCDNFFSNASKCADQLLITYHFSHSMFNVENKQDALDMRLNNGWLSNFSLSDVLNSIEANNCSMLNFHSFPIKKHYQEIAFLIASAKSNHGITS